SSAPTRRTAAPPATSRSPPAIPARAGARCSVQWLCVHCQDLVVDPMSKSNVGPTYGTIPPQIDTPITRRPRIPVPAARLIMNAPLGLAKLVPGIRGAETGRRARRQPVPLAGNVSSRLLRPSGPVDKFEVPLRKGGTEDLNLQRRTAVHGAPRSP